MNTLSASAAALGICCTLIGCATLPDEPARGGRFTLSEHQSLALSPAVTLRYDSVADSRCPPDAKCIWAGAVSYHLSLHSPRAVERFVFKHDGDAFASEALPGVTVVLTQGAELAPPPGHAIVVDVTAPSSPQP